MVIVAVPCLASRVSQGLPRGLRGPQNLLQALLLILRKSLCSLNLVPAFLESPGPLLKTPGLISTISLLYYLSTISFWPKNKNRDYLLKGSPKPRSMLLTHCVTLFAHHNGVRHSQVGTEGSEFCLHPPAEVETEVWRKEISCSKPC